AISTFSTFWITRYKFLPVMLTTISSTSIVLFFITLGDRNFQYLYMTLSSFIFMFALIGLDKFFVQQREYGSERREKRIKIFDSGFNLNQSIIMISLFLLSSGIYGIYINFAFSTWIVIFIIFLGVFASTIYLTQINFIKSKELELHLDSAKNKTFTFYSFLLAFLMSELVWTISFWPANQLTVGAIVLITYYTAWNILRSYLRNELTRSVIIYNLIFFLIFGFTIMATSKWGILSVI
ncbi:MAG: hypothetical protein WA063_04940, partial [Minisyncoccia bacterium]